jgi:uncharacterized protein with GYD domain
MPEETVMPMYLHQWNYKDQQIRKMLDESIDLDREEVVRTATEAFGGTLHAFYFCFGAYDGLAITEFRDETTALACVMAVFGQGRVQDVTTTPLFTPADGKKAVRYAQEVLRGDAGGTIGG